MECTRKEKKDGVLVFCEESKVGNWIASHILSVVGGIFLFFSLLNGLFEGKIYLWRGLVITAFMLWLAILFRILFRNMCGRVEIDTATEKIKFFRFYHNVVEAPVRSVQFHVAWKFTCFYAGEKFIIPGGYTNSIAEVLPEGVEIKFSENFWGRLAKRQFQKRTVNLETLRKDVDRSDPD